MNWFAFFMMIGFFVMIGIFVMGAVSAIEQGVHPLWIVGILVLIGATIAGLTVK